MSEILMDPGLGIFTVTNLTNQFSFTLNEP